MEEFLDLIFAVVVETSQVTSLGLNGPLLTDIYKYRDDFPNYEALLLVVYFCTVIAVIPVLVELLLYQKIPVLSPLYKLFVRYCCEGSDSTQLDEDGRQKVDLFKVFLGIKSTIVRVLVFLLHDLGFACTWFHLSRYTAKDSLSYDLESQVFFFIHAFFALMILINRQKEAELLEVIDWVKTSTFGWYYVGVPFVCMIFIYVLGFQVLLDHYSLVLEVLGWIAFGGLICFVLNIGSSIKEVFGPKIFKLSKNSVSPADTSNPSGRRAERVDQADGAASVTENII